MTVPKRAVWARFGYLLFAGLFALGVLAQVFLAGLAIFVDASYWARHTTFVHLLEPTLLVWLIVGAVSRLSTTLKLIPLGVYVLIVVQYATANLPGSVVAAFHPVNALVMFLVVLVALRGAWTQVSESSTAG